MDIQAQPRRSSEQVDTTGRSAVLESSRKNSEDTGGARARNAARKHSNSSTLPKPSDRTSSANDCEKAPKVTPRSNVNSKNDPGGARPLLITQNSWASRDQGINMKSATASAKILHNKKATSTQEKPTADTLNINSNGGHANGARKASLASAQNDNSNNAEIPSFSSSRNIWERRASSQSTASASNLADRNGGQSQYNMSASVEGNQQVGVVGPNPVSVAFQLQRGGFRNNRDLWEQRGAMRQKQTPDLVIDLPVSSLSTSPNRTQSSSPPSSASSASVASANTAAVAPLPRPRKSISPSDNPAANIEYDDKPPTRATAAKPSAKPRKL